MPKNILNIKSRYEFRHWLSINHDKEAECFIMLKRGKPIEDNSFYYLDAVEEALCYGWIDSTLSIIDGINYQRFTPRKKNSNWTELNKERARRLIKLGLMTKYGASVLPDLSNKSFKIDNDILDILKENRIYSKFKRYPKLYQRIRISNLIFYKKKDINIYDKMLSHFIEETKKEKMFGNRNDYGRLLNY